MFLRYEILRVGEGVEVRFDYALYESESCSYGDLWHFLDPLLDDVKQCWSDFGRINRSRR